MAKDSRVGISLEATNRASGAINEVKRSLGGLEGAAGLATKGLAGLAGAFGAGALLGLAQNIGAAAVQMAQAAAASEMVGTSMQGLAASFGESADEMLDSLKRASNGTIAEYDLMLGANKAMMLGVAQNSHELEGIMKVALTRGAAMGLSTTQAFDNLVTGLGRGSALILDNLGITMAQLRQAEEGYAASLGKTTEALSDQEKKQAMVNAVLKEAEAIDLSNVDGMAHSFAQAQAAIADMKVALGEMFGPAIAAVAKQIAAAVEGVNEAMDARKTDSLIGDQWEIGPALTEAINKLREFRNEEALLLFQQIRDPSIDTSYITDKIAITRDEIRRLGEEWNTTADQLNNGLQLDLSALEQGVVKFADLNNVIAGSGSAAIQAAGGMQMASGVISQMGLGAEAAGSGVRAFTGELDRSGSSAQSWALIVAGTSQETEGLGSSSRRAAGELRNLGSAGGQSTSGLLAAGEAAAAARAEMDALAEAAFRARIAVLGAAQDSIRATAIASAGTLGADAAMQQYGDNLRTVRKEWLGLTKQGKDTTEIEFRLAETTQGLNEQTMEQVRALEALEAEATRASGGSSGTGLKGYESALRAANLAGQDLTYTINGLRSKVQGQLSGALNLDIGGVNPDDYLPREDAVNENARRLADIMVNGFKGQDWLAEFQAEVPDIYAALMDSQDPKAAAAQMLKDFQDGLLPGLIDKESVKEKVKRAILGESNMAALASEITAELVAEMGADPAQVAGLVNSAMGRSAGETSQGDLTGAVVTQLKSQQFTNAVQGAAASLGRGWGDAFLSTVGSNVPQGLIDILFGLVMQYAASQQSRTGAN